MSSAEMILAPVSLPAAERPAVAYLANLGRGSRRTMRQALEVCAGILTGGRCGCETCPWHALRWVHTSALRGELIDRYAPATVRKCLSALRGVLRAAWRLGQMAAEDFYRAVDLRPVRGATLPAGRGLGPEELAALFEACEATPAGRRDAALLAVLYYGGLRRAEACALALADWDRAAGWLQVLGGKGGKDRRVPVADRAAGWLRAWLAVRGTTPGPLFCHVRGDTITLRPLSPAGVYDALGRLVERTGVAHCSPHDLRRSFVSDLLDAGADLSTVQRLAGHASPMTTARYDRRGERALQRAATLLDREGVDSPAVAGP